MDVETKNALATLREHVDLGFAEVRRRFEQTDEHLVTIDQRFVTIDQRFVAIDQRFVAIDQRFVAIDQRFEQIDRRFDQVEQRIDATAAETRRHFDVVAESLRADIRPLAEGFTRVDRLEVSLREEIARSHHELATLMRLGFADHERRITALEQRARDTG